MPAGRVIGLDKDAQFLAHARTRAPANVEFRQGDAYASDLPADSFDLVHMRFLASTPGDPERVIREAIRLCRPGGVVALQEPDCATLNCYPPHPAWEKLKRAVIGAFSGIGGDVHLGQRLYGMVRQIGLLDVQYRPVLIGVRSTDPMVDYLPATVESLRGTITKLGLLSDDEFPSILAETRRHLQKPDTVFTLYTVAQVWGRKPRGAVIPRGLDHIVHAVHDLDAAGEAYARLGFTVGARNRHPWGTHNRIVQFPGVFIELLGDRRDRTHSAGAAAHAFVRRLHARFPRARRGAVDAGAGRQGRGGRRRSVPRGRHRRFRRVRFRARGQAPGRLDREGRVLARVRRGPEAPDTGFFTCQQHYPENFWNPGVPEASPTA